MLMTESFTPSLFVYPHFLCTTFAASWLFVPWKRTGCGIMSQWYFASIPSENTDFTQTRTPKNWSKNIANTFPDVLVILKKNWQNSQLDQLYIVKLLEEALGARVTSQLDKMCLSPSPPAPLLITLHVVTCQVELSTCQIIISAQV